MAATKQLLFAAALLLALPLALSAEKVVNAAAPYVDDLGAYLPAATPALVTKAPAAKPTTTPKAPVAKPGTCIMTGLPPSKPDGPLPRCVAEQEMSCCSVCQDAGVALSVLSKNGSALMGFLNLNADPTIASFASALSGSFNKLPFCSLFKKNQMCLNMVESMYCAFNCNPSAGTFLTLDANMTGTSAVCTDFASKLYEACSTIILPGVNAPLSQYIADPDTLLALVVAPLVQTNTPLKKLILSVASPDAPKGSCFSGPAGGKYANSSLCCDELTDVPQSCITPTSAAKFAGSSDTSVLQNLIGRPLGKECPVTPGAVAAATPPPKGAAPQVSAFSALTSLLTGSAMFLAFVL